MRWGNEGTRTVDGFVEHAVHHKAEGDAGKHEAKDWEDVQGRRHSAPERERADYDGQQGHWKGEYEGREQPAQPEQLWVKAHDEHHLFDLDLRGESSAGSMGNNAKNTHMARCNRPLFQKSCKEQAICTQMRTPAARCKELAALAREIDRPAAEKYDESENILA